MSAAPRSPDGKAPPAAGGRGPSRRFMKQPQMRRVLYALVPVLLSAIYFFGWRALAVLAVCNVAGMAVEYFTSRSRGQPMSIAGLVTCCLYALSLPPTTPLWIAVVGVVVAVLFGKEVFGGFGRNFANPAIVGRAFVYVCFPVELTARFVPAFKGFPGGFAHWSFEHLGELPGYVAAAGRGAADAVSQATPMWVAREFGEAAVGRAAGTLDLLTGSIGGVFEAEGRVGVLSAGSMGEGCAALIVLSAAYLLVTRTANWRLMLSCLAGVVLANVLFRNVLGFDGVGGVPSLPFTLLAGTTVYALVYNVTDPVSAPRRKPAMIAYGLLIGFLIVFLRWRNVFVAAATFSILIGNLVGPLLDMGAAAWSDRRKAAAAKGDAA